MADRAVELGRRIAVLATLPSALEPTAALVRARAAARGDAIELVPRLVEGAFAAIQAGDPSDSTSSYGRRSGRSSTRSMSSCSPRRRWVGSSTASVRRPL